MSRLPCFNHSFKVSLLFEFLKTSTVLSLSYLFSVSSDILLCSPFLISSLSLSFMIFRLNHLIDHSQKHVWQEVELKITGT